MTEPLERECRTFTRYLVRREPTAYVIEKYRAAHTASAGMAHTGHRFDARLTAIARQHPVLTVMADAYARFFAPRGALRKKLVLLLAILESSPPFFRELDLARATPVPLQAAALAVRVAVFLLALTFGTLLFLPLRIVTR